MIKLNKNLTLNNEIEKRQKDQDKLLLLFN